MSTPSTLTKKGNVVDFAMLSWGSDGDPLAVLLHGYPDSPRSWQGLAPLLVDAGYRVVAPWTRGYAPSSTPADDSYHIGALAHDAIELHDLLDGDERAVLVGHDWGAVAAHAVAGLPNQPYRRVVTLAVPPMAAFLDRSDGAAAWLRRQVKQVPLSWYAAFQQIPVVSERALPNLVPFLWTHWSPGFDSERERDAAWSAMQARRTPVLQYYRHAAAFWRVPSTYRREQRGIRCLPQVPMLYLHGANDHCVHSGWLEPTRSVLPPGCHVAEVAAAGHFLHAEQPSRVAELIVEFLGSA